MTTLYQAIQRFYLKDRFRFKLKHKNEMGSRLREIWKNMHPDVPTESVISKEDTGEYRVISYPDHFTPIIDQLIRNYHTEILDASKARKEKERAAALPPPPVTPKKERKRIPVKQIPAWRAK